eukprot:GHVU01015397.1.p2 GENE.GHVU01015397.1~~GHVU01015397.1.p2  ORF type:complete len:121 (-),score=7.66 GHVU01015397.1:1003-1365(-)
MTCPHSRVTTTLLPRSLLAASSTYGSLTPSSTDRHRRNPKCRCSSLSIRLNRSRELLLGVLSQRRGTAVPSPPTGFAVSGLDQLDLLLGERSLTKRCRRQYVLLGSMIPWGLVFSGRMGD